MARRRDPHDDPDPRDLAADAAIPRPPRPRPRTPPETPTTRFRRVITGAASNLLEANRGLVQASASAHGPDGRMYTAHARRDLGITRTWIVEGAAAPERSVEEETPEDLRDRMGKYIAEQLPRHHRIATVRWPLAVTWDDYHVTATLTRGELVIRTQAGKHGWWHPSRKSQANEHIDTLATVLAELHRRVADADETGRCRGTAWVGPSGRIWGRSGIEADAHPVSLLLEPGVYLDWDRARQRFLAWRVDQPAPGTDPVDASNKGWLRILEDGDV